ncbi:MAG TPA: class I SAM-dependent methyltransferase [Bacteroidales bacterium]|nr:class I SAM-dependent methyltransferase [Bacteroidales bacterium]
MNEFDLKAAGWDDNPMHTERSRAIADNIRKNIPLNKNMKALEFGAGTGTTSFFLSGDLGEITMLDSSPEMVKRTKEKIQKSDLENLKAFELDLEHNDFPGRFDLIFTQLVMHHIQDIESIIRKFYELLNQSGYLAIADLYKESGSFHGEGFAGHNGFDPDELSVTLEKAGFTGMNYTTCFTIMRDVAGKGLQPFDVFLLTCKKKLFPA